VELGERLKEARLKAGLTQSQLGEPLYSPSFISTIEGGKRRPSMAAAQHFATKLSLTVEELFLGGSRETALKIQERIHQARRDMSTDAVDKAKKSLASAAREAEAEGLTMLQGQAEYLRALIVERAGDIKKALELYQAVEDLLRDNPVGATDAITGRARCFQILGELRYATHLLEAHLARLRIEGLEDPDALIRLYTSLVAVYFDADLEAQAAHAAASAMRLGGEKTEPERLANMYVHVARVHMTTQRFDEAEKAFDKANDIYEQMQLPLEKGRVKLARAFALIPQDRISEARVELEQALEVFRASGHVANETRAMLQLGRVLRIQGQHDQSQLILRRVAKLAAEGTDSERGIAEKELGITASAAGDRMTAIRHLEKAIKLLEKADDLRELAKTYRILGDMRAEEEKRLSPAAEAYRQSALVGEKVA
jgi:tetratricopeptide (TPR) repeat protein